jgi:hypothetical protein
MNLNIDDTVTWSCAAGDMEGVITNICLNLNAADQTVPWIDIQAINKQGWMFSTRLCATEQNLKMMRVAKVELATA